jgi:drug/metabolite transporter (DMT)-like permease
VTGHDRAQPTLRLQRRAISIISDLRGPSSNPSRDAPSAALGVVTVVLTLVGWSSVPLFLRHFRDLIDDFTSNGWRYGFSALLWAPVLVVLAFGKQLPKGLWKAAIVPSLFNALGQACFTRAFYFMDPGLVTFGLRCQLVFVALGAWILFKPERAIIRTRSYLAGVGLLILGTSAVLLLDENVFHVAHLTGGILAVVSGLLFACYGLSVRKFMHNINPLIAFAAICQFTGAAMVSLMLLIGRRHGADVLDLPPNQIMLLLVSAVIGIAIGHVFYYISIARLGVAVTAGVLQLQPFIVALGSLALFDERLTAWQWMGGCLAVAGAMLMLSVQRRLSRQKHVSLKPVEIAEGESGS